MDVYDHDYPSTSDEVTLPSIKSLHFPSDNVSAFKIVTSFISCHDLMNLLSPYKVQYRFSVSHPFCEGSLWTSFHFYSVLVGVLKLWNRLSPLLNDLVLLKLLNLSGTSKKGFLISLNSYVWCSNSFVMLMFQLFLSFSVLIL